MDEFRWVYEEDTEAVAQVSAGLQDGTRARCVNQNRNYRKDGTVIHCEWYNSSRRDKSGKLISILSFVLDITEREKAAEALRQSEGLFRAVTDNSRDAIYVKDCQSRWLLANPALLRIVGKASRDVLGRSDAEIYAEPLQ